MRTGWIDLPEKYMHALVSMMKDNGELKKLRVIGTSMAPTIQKGATIELTNEIDNLAVGDIVFININHFTTHRLIDVVEEKGKTYYITKGDAIKEKTEKIELKDIIGKVIGYENPRL
jgi:signal peptidase I